MQLRQLQVGDPVVGSLLRNIEGVGIDKEHVIHDGLLYFRDPKVICSLHPMKQLKLYVPTVIRPTVLKY